MDNKIVKIQTKTKFFINLTKESVLIKQPKHKYIKTI